MSARVYRFRETEADSELPLTVIREELQGIQALLQTTPPAGLIESDDEDGCPTTRRFARSAHGVDAAWPDDPQYADPFGLSSSFAEQDREVAELSWKWANRAIAAIAALVVIGLAARWF